MKTATRTAPRSRCGLGLLAAGLLGGTLAGCGGAPGEPSAAPPPATSEAASGNAAARPIALRIANWEETQQLVAAQQGKVVVLDLWATW